MSAPIIQIPKRFSSIAAVEEHRLKIRTSRQDLKRKLSDSSVEKGSTRHIKLRIEDVELEQEELELDKAQLDLEANQSLIDKKSHHNACRSMHKRNFSLGDELWELKHQLRAHDESIGVAAALTPDSEGAFVSALLHLYKDPRVSKKCWSMPSRRECAMALPWRTAWKLDGAQGRKCPRAYWKASLLFGPKAQGQKHCEHWLRANAMDLQLAYK